MGDGCIPFQDTSGPRVEDTERRRQLFLTVSLSQFLCGLILKLPHFFVAKF
jgi:hypothetical protein